MIATKYRAPRTDQVPFLSSGSVASSMNAMTQNASRPQNYHCAISSVQRAGSWPGLSLLYCTDFPCISVWDSNFDRDATLCTSVNIFCGRGQRSSFLVLIFCVRYYCYCLDILCHCQLSPPFIPSAPARSHSSARTVQ